MREIVNLTDKDSWRLSNAPIIADEYQYVCDFAFKRALLNFIIHVVFPANTDKNLPLVVIPFFYNARPALTSTRNWKL